ncbi:MAG: hypothetical protein FD180_2217 [Planctomycetota bacterium]|nr:MAG: hypothetical protein FD180_2217 [Planctomycetota bacterium]
MREKTGRLLQMLLVCLHGLSGLLKFVPAARENQLIAAVGYPEPVIFAFGALQMLGAAMFAFRRTLPFGAVVLTAASLFALYGYLTRGVGVAAAAPVVLSVLPGLSWYLLSSHRTPTLPPPE